MTYATDITTLANAVLSRGFVPTSEDPSQDLLVYLSAAYAAVERLKNQGVDLELSGNPLVAPSLVRAYREALHVRRTVPPEFLDTSFITKLGRLA